MYTNICTNHALSVMGPFFRRHPECHNAEAIIKGLTLLMRNNIFCFGDTYWKQLSGTAMGAPPACDYAMIYFGIHELALQTLIEKHTAFYARYIDDGLGIWVHNPDGPTDTVDWVNFQQQINNFGNLTWDFSTRSQSTPFLDLTITFDGLQIYTTLYEKPMNLYQFIPPNSAHSRAVLRGFIIGLVVRIFRLTTRHADRILATQNLFDRLLAWGYLADSLCHFLALHLKKSRTHRHRARTSTWMKRYFSTPYSIPLHLPPQTFNYSSTDMC